MRLHFLKTFLPACFLITFLMTIPFSVQAAVVILKNGDQITGRIVKMEKQRLEIDPPFSDIIKIKWDDVQSITSERPMSILLYGESDMPENAGEQNHDRIILNSLGEDGAIRLEDVRAINFAEHYYRGYISAGGNQSSGNSQTEALNVSGNLTYRRLEHRYILDGKYNRGQADGKDTAMYQAFTTDPATVMPSTTWTMRYEFMIQGNDVIVFHKQQGFKDLGHGSATRVNADQA